MQARNDTCALPLEDFAAILKGAGMPVGHRIASSRAVSLRTSELAW
ncbi:MAG: hypothetical protein K9G11_00855 [Rickettsiaceae bacterium]|nr:hypothetical protein [Rickettsiaceae bacterium]